MSASEPAFWIVVVGAAGIVTMASLTIIAAAINRHASLAELTLEARRLRASRQRPTAARKAPS